MNHLSFEAYVETSKHWVQQNKEEEEEDDDDDDDDDEKVKVHHQHKSFKFITSLKDNQSTIVFEYRYMLVAVCTVSCI